MRLSTFVIFVGAALLTAAPFLSALYGKERGAIRRYGRCASSLPQSLSSSLRPVVPTPLRIWSSRSLLWLSRSRVCALSLWRVSPTWWGLLERGAVTPRLAGREDRLINHLRRQPWSSPFSDGTAAMGPNRRAQERERAAARRQARPSCQPLALAFQSVVPF